MGLGFARKTPGTPEAVGEGTPIPVVDTSQLLYHITCNMAEQGSQLGYLPEDVELEEVVVVVVEVVVVEVVEVVVEVVVVEVVLCPRVRV